MRFGKDFCAAFLTYALSQTTWGLTTPYFRVRFLYAMLLVYEFFAGLTAYFTSMEVMCKLCGFLRLSTWPILSLALLLHLNPPTAYTYCVTFRIVIP